MGILGLQYALVLLASLIIALGGWKLGATAGREKWMIRGGAMIAACIIPPWLILLEQPNWDIMVSVWTLPIIIILRLWQEQRKRKGRQAAQITKAEENPPK